MEEMPDVGGASVEAGSVEAASIGAVGRKRGISGSTVKIVAVAAMLIDHIAAVILARLIMGGGYLEALWGGDTALGDWLAENGNLYGVYTLMRSIGRLGFPLFCFLLAEGFQRTRNVKKYALRLGLFALISEIPFNLAIAGHVTASGYQNVFFTLLLGLFVLCIWRFFENGAQSKMLGRLPRPLRWLFAATGTVLPGIYFGIWLGGKFFYAGGWEVRDYLSGTVPFPSQFIGVCGALCAALAVFFLLCGKKKGAEWVCAAGADLTALVLIMYLADLLRTDYAGFGVLTIGVMYAFRRNRLGAMAAGCAVLTLLLTSELPAFLALIPVALYNGSRGLKMKYFFYAFYPVHLLLLYLIAVWMGLGSVTPL